MTERDETRSDSGEIEPTKQYELVRSILPTLGKPTVESTRYALHIRASMTEWHELDGLPAQWGKLRTPEFWQSKDIPVENNPERVSQFLSNVASKLAWLEFFANTEVTVKQSDLAIANGRHYSRAQDPTRQVLQGDLFSVGSVYYATDYSPTSGVTLHTHEQIVSQQTLTPYMEEWLSRILHKDNRNHPSHRYLKPFAGWLKPTRPDLDIPDYLASKD
jgi:hypothetical protein